MERRRVKCVLEEPWGRAIIYTDVGLPDAPQTILKEPSATNKVPSQQITVSQSALKATSLVSQHDVDPENHLLVYFQSCLFATILEDTITEFQILVECNTGMRISKTMADITKLSAKKFGVEEPTVVDELEGIDPNMLDCIEYKLKKLHVDRLVYFQSCLFATILEDTITEFQILVECNTGMRISKTMADITKLSAKKFGVEEPTVVDELEGIDPNMLDCIEYKLKKLHVDREYVNNVLISLYTDLARNQSFNALAMHVKSTIAHDEFQEFLTEDEAKNRTSRRDLAKQLRQQRNQQKSITYDTDSIIEDLKTQVEDAALNAQIRSRYIENWQRSRTEQHIKTIEDVESVPSQLIELYKQRTDHEQRVHSEVELFINIAINETLTKVEEWMNKYDKDMEDIDLRIQIRKSEYQNQKETRIELDETYVKHGQLMKDWIQFKEERERKRQYIEKMNKSAIIVQAWWRGLLVRLELGPYKPPKKKGSKKDKKKNKKK